MHMTVCDVRHVKQHPDGAAGLFSYAMSRFSALETLKAGCIAASAPVVAGPAHAHVSRTVISLLLPLENPGAALQFRAEACVRVCM